MIPMIFWATSPTILILVFFYFRDRFKEPPRIVFYTFVLGILSLIPISIGNIFLDLYGDGLDASYFAKDFYTYVLRAAFHEELYKYLILVYFCSRHTEFDEPMDAIVYGVAVSLGYAAFENVEYVLDYADFDSTWQEMAAIRVLPTIMHGVNGAIMGFLLSNVLFVHRDHAKLILALLVPVFFHGAYNILITYASSGLSILLLLITIIYGFVLNRRIRKFQQSKIIETEIKETLSHTIVFQSIFFTLILVIISVAVVININ
jgi:RsiW-degrading membrane proteinase PrsW (M82 family)